MRFHSLNPPVLKASPACRLFQADAQWPSLKVAFEHLICTVQYSWFAEVKVEAYGECMGNRPDDSLVQAIADDGFAMQEGSSYARIV